MHIRFNAFPVKIPKVRRAEWIDYKPTNVAAMGLESDHITTIPPHETAAPLQVLSFDGSSPGKQATASGSKGADRDERRRPGGAFALLKVSVRLRAQGPGKLRWSAITFQPANERCSYSSASCCIH